MKVSNGLRRQALLARPFAMWASKGLSNLSVCLTHSNGARQHGLLSTILLAEYMPKGARQEGTPVDLFSQPFTWQRGSHMLDGCFLCAHR